MTALELWELASYVVTVVGLPFAIGIFFYEQRKERENEDEAGYLQLAEAYGSSSSWCSRTPISNCTRWGGHRISPRSSASG